MFCAPACVEGCCCTSGRDILHQVRHKKGGFRRMCSSCVLLCHPAAFCSACISFLSPSETTTSSSCSRCGRFAAHRSCCVLPSFFVCPSCAAAAAGRRSFSYGAVGASLLDERAARILLVAAQIAHQSVARAAAEARQEAERRAQEAAVARKRSREALDVAFQVFHGQVAQP